jgi:hypothetical protein
LVSVENIRGIVWPTATFGMAAKIAVRSLVVDVTSLNPIIHPLRARPLNLSSRRDSGT